MVKLDLGGQVSSGRDCEIDATLVLWSLGKGASENEARDPPWSSSETTWDHLLGSATMRIVRSFAPKGLWVSVHAVRV